MQPEHGFYQQNGLERDQVQDCCPNEKMVVVPACLNGRCCSSRMYEYIVLTKMKSLLLLAFRRYDINAIFLKYSKEDRYNLKKFLRHFKQTCTL